MLLPYLLQGKAARFAYNSAIQPAREGKAPPRITMADETMCCPNGAIRVPSVAFPPCLDGWFSPCFWQVLPVTLLCTCPAYSCREQTSWNLSFFFSFVVINAIAHYFPRTPTFSIASHRQPSALAAVYLPNSSVELLPWASTEYPYGYTERETCQAKLHQSACMQNLQQPRGTSTGGTQGRSRGRLFCWSP